MAREEQRRGHFLGVSPGTWLTIALAIAAIISQWTEIKLMVQKHDDHIKLLWEKKETRGHKH
jgi:hypothetical protein